MALVIGRNLGIIARVRECRNTLSLGVNIF